MCVCVHVRVCVYMCVCVCAYVCVCVCVCVYTLCYIVYTHIVLLTVETTQLQQLKMS